MSTKRSLTTPFAVACGLSLLVAAAPAMSRSPNMGFPANSSLSGEKVESRASDPERLKELRGKSSLIEYNPAEEGAGKARFNALSQAAFSWGVQEGMYWRYAEINKHLEDTAQTLHTIFDFSKFIVDGKMLMPSVVEANRVYEQRNDTSARTVKVSYTIEKPSRIVPQPPTWRDYLSRTVDTPQEPHAAIFPRTPIELKEWNKQLGRGWDEGVDQANTVFEHDLRRLSKDVEGMYRFRKLLAMGVLSMPKIGSSEYATISFDDGRTLNINDVVYEITAEAEFSELDKWEPYFRQAAEAEQGGQ